MANETVVRITADASGYFAELTKAKTSAQAFAASQDALSARIKSAQDAITEATTNGSNASSRSVNAFMTSLARQADQAGRTRAEILQMQAAMLGVSDAAKKYVDAIAKADAANSGGGHGGSNGIAREGLVMAHEALTGNYSRLGGSAMVMAERLDLTKFLNPTTVGIAAMTAATLALITAMNSVQEQVDKFNASLKLTNDWAGVTRESAAQLAQTVATQMGTSFGTAQANIDATVASGRVLGQDLQTVTELAMDMAKQTGDSFDKALEKVTAQSDNVQKAAEDWQKSHHDMSQATLDHIKAVDEAGDHVTALRILYEQELQTMQAGTSTRVGFMSQMWHTFLDDIGRMGRTLTGNSTQADQLASLKSELNDTGPEGVNAYGVNTKAIQDQIAALEQQANAAADAKAKTDAIKSAQASLAQIQQTVNDQIEKGASNEEKRTKAIKAANDQYAQRIALAKQAQTYTPALDSQFAAQRDKLVADAGRQYKDPKPKQYHDDASTTMLQQLRDQDAAVQAQLGSTDKLSDAQQQLVKFNQQINDWQGKTLTADQQSLVAHQDEIRSALQLLAAHQADLSVAQEKAKLREAADRAAQSAVNYQANQKQQYSRQLDAFGMGADAQKQAEAVKSIYAHYNGLQDEITKTASKNGLLGGDDYQKDIADNQAALQKSLQLYSDYYSELKAKQADWKNGVSTAMQDYIDESNNAAAQAQKTFTDATKGMEDAIVSFATTGKLSFTSLANSIISDIIRMQVKSAASGLLGSLSSIGGSLLGGFFSSNTSVAASTASALPGNSLDNLMNLTNGFGTVPARAGGGNVSGGQPYYIGEQGPELFVPGASGTIVPNNALSSSSSGGGSSSLSVSVPVTVQGNASRSDQQNAADLSTKIKQAVQAVLQNERKQGGVLWKMQNGRQ